MTKTITLEVRQTLTGEYYIPTDVLMNALSSLNNKDRDLAQELLDSDGHCDLVARRTDSDTWVAYPNRNAFTRATGVNLIKPRKGTADRYGGSRSTYNPEAHQYQVRFRTKTVCETVSVIDSLIS